MTCRTVLMANLALGLLLPGFAAAEAGPMVVGNQGTILKVHSGSYGELFHDGNESPSENSVLALDVLRPSGLERFLVPTTGNRELEEISALYFGKDSGLTYLLWEGLVNGAHPFVNLASFDGSQWSDVIAIAGSVFADKGSADLVIVPESDPVPKAAHSDMPSKRTVIYVVWKEITPSGGGEDFLVPIILEDGEYIGWRQVFNLSDLLHSADGLADNHGKGHGGRPLAALDPNLEDILKIQPSAKGNAIVVGFISLETGQFVTLEFEMLPLALSAMAERVKELIIHYSESSTTVEDLISQVQTGILNDGSEFHPSILEYLANQLADLLSEHSSVAAATAPSVLDKTGVYMIGVGARVRRKGLVDLEPLGIYSLGQTSSGEPPYHYLKVSKVAEREAPEVDGKASLFLSRTGDHALVAWTAESKVYYRETEGAAWGERQSVELRDGLDQETVHGILFQRTLNR